MSPREVGAYELASRDVSWFHVPENGAKSHRSNREGQGSELSLSMRQPEIRTHHVGLLQPRLCLAPARLEGEQVETFMQSVPGVHKQKLYGCCSTAGQLKVQNLMTPLSQMRA